MNILLIEDNQTIAKQIAEFLSFQGFEVDHADKGKHGAELALQHFYDAIILDLCLPDIDGIEVCKQIKQDAEVEPPILMLTARDSFADKSAGFTQGADDYLTKPFDLRELALRVKALTRRHQLHQSKSLHFGDIEVDLRMQQVTREGKPLKLTSIGCQILVALIKAHPEPVSRSRLVYEIWGDSPPDTDALKSHIYALRQAVDKPFAKNVITTVLNVGFKLDMP